MPDSVIDNNDITLSEEDGIRYLHFGTEWIQGAMRMSRPHDLVLTYTQQMMAWLLFQEVEREDELAILGLGAASLLRFCMKYTPSNLHTVELNPRVTAMCKTFFRLPDHARSTIYHADAAQWVCATEHQGRYAALMVDLYDAHAQGPVCSSLAFYQHCYAVLAERGIMSVNLFGAHHSYDENIDHIMAAFDGQVLLLPEIDEGNIVALAFKGGHLGATTAASLMQSAEHVQTVYKIPARQWAKAILAAQPT
ncbi:MAG TPA: spermidine synthase [Paenalcaligenes hominis]|uniref:Spermidine synthase n=1 Tax=Paenalcaligenes hominis TaxID=643674 RepID=A0A9D2VEW0_9BURK|nr:spermidine synthase [Paenalcaligenes hominis]